MRHDADHTRRWAARRLADTRPFPRHGEIAVAVNAGMLLHPDSAPGGAAVPPMVDADHVGKTDAKAAGKAGGGVMMMVMARGCGIGRQHPGKQDGRDHDRVANHDAHPLNSSSTTIGSMMQLLSP